MPHDIIKALASDVPDVSVGILEHSIVLDEDDLVEIIKATSQMEKWMAISRRKNLTSRVSRTLIETKHSQVIASLLDNKTAEIDDVDIEELVNQYKGDQTVVEALVCRGGLSPQFTEKLFHMVADKLKKQLTRRYRLSWGLVNKTTEVARETSILRFLTPRMTTQEIEKMVKQMQRNKRLNYSMILRSLCLGEVRFFEIAMASMVNIPVENARALMLDSGPLGFNALYDSSTMPAGFGEAIKVLYRFALLETNDGKDRPADFQRRMIDRVVSNGYHDSVENMSYFLSIMKQQTYGPAVVH